MPLAPNTRLGRYEIRSQIGEGGMGEVYRAFDQKINREVAIKVLPAAFSADKDRLARFEQEAQAAGALNHPNILAIYDVDTHDGAPYVVSELLEGETLHDRINGAAIPAGKALDYALQVAKGLAAAHERGIVHRDLKPENLFVTTDGRVKILDFGLAKLTEPFCESDAQTDVPTRKVKTQPGAVIGTVGYMSPEQVRGRAVDHRSDIFSFGAVFYEMLSGKRAFRGESAVDTLSAILKEDPPDLSTINSNVAPALERIVRHCLEKNPEKRFQSVRDLAFDLETLSGTSGSSVRSTSDAAITPERSKGRRWPVLIGAGLLAAIAIAAGAFFFGKRAGETSPPLYHQLTFRRGTIYNARFAPDGHTIVYSAAWNGTAVDIFSTRTESTESRSLGLAHPDVLAISSSGEMAVLLNRHYLYWFVSRGTLARASLLGGRPREIVEDVQEADWSPDGTQLAIVRYVDGRNRLEYPIGKVLYETAGYISHPRVSPKGDMIAFMDHQLEGDNRGWVAVVDLAGNKTILSGEWADEEGLAWSSSGNEVWFTASKGGEPQALYAVALSGRERLVARVPVNMLLHDISRDGRVLLTRYNAPSDIVGLPPGETKERDLSWLDSGDIRDLSADGKTLLFSYEGEGSGVNYAAYLRRTDGSPAVRIGEGAAIALSPDGKWALSLLSTSSEIVLLPTGAGEIQRLERGGIEQYGASGWFPDGKRVVFYGREKGHGWRCYIQEIGTSSPRPITPEAIIGTVYAVVLISPDGKYVLAADAPQRKSLYPIEGGEPRLVPGLDNEDEVIRWSADGRSVYVARTQEMPIRVYRLDLSTGRKELIKQVAPADPAGIFWPNNILMTPDAKGYVYEIQRHLSDLYLVEGLK